jgi:hypothetical protein
VTVAAKCVECFALRYAGEEGWTRNGNGWFCERHSPQPSSSTREVNKDYDEDEGQDYVEDYRPPTQPPSPIPSSPEDEAVVVWLLRAHRAGDLQPKSVKLPALPPSATPSMRTVAEFYRLVRGLRLLDDDERPVPFGCEWVGSHTGVSKVAVWKSLRELVACGVLKRAGKMPPRRGMRDPGKRPVHLYLPGDGGAS